MDDIWLHIEKISREIKRLVYLILSLGLYYTGAINLFRLTSRLMKREGTIKILAYHNIGNGKYLDLDVPEKVFESQIEYLVKNRYNIISLEKAIRLLQSEAPIPPNTVVITFDDGYKSMYTSVLPLVKKYKIPVTIFLAVGPIENQIPLFVDAIIYAIDKTARESIDLSPFGLGKYFLKSRSSKERAISKINDYSKTLSTADRKRLLEYIFRELDVDMACRELKEKMLSWEEIKEMKRYGVSFGAHTISHPLLTKIPLQEAIFEIIQSKKAIQEKIGDDVTFFAYPYGLLDSFNYDIARAVEKNGFLCACTLLRGSNKKGDDLFSLKRNTVTNMLSFKSLLVFSKAVFATQISGIIDLLLFRSSSY